MEALLNATAARMLVLNDRREDLLDRLRKAESRDNSYSHNDEILRSVERGLEEVEEEIQALLDDSADNRLFGGAE